MKETKRVWKFFQYRECDAFAAYLEKMALEGWHLETVGLGMTFKKGESKKVRYEIEVFSKATEYDTKAEPAAEEFSEYCETAGWEFVCAYRKFCIYRTENPDVVPIETDERQRFENIKKASLSIKRNMLLYTLFLCVFEMFRSSSYVLLDPMAFAMSIFILGITLWVFLVFAEEIFWNYRTRKSLIAGESVAYEKEFCLMKLFNIVTPVALTVIIIILSIYANSYYALVILAVVSFIYTFYYILRIKLKLSREHSFVLGFGTVFGIYFLCAVFIVMQARKPDDSLQQDYSKVDVSLHSYDLNGANDKTEKILSYEKDVNFLSSREYCQIEYGETSKSYMWYEIIESDSDWVLDRFWKEKLHPRLPEAIHDLKKDDYKILEKEAERWDAVSFAQLDFLWREYMIRYPDRLIILQYDGEITPEIIEKVKNLKIEK